jgi:PP-loop superfamily ATP-utilizing enzyme
MPEASKKPVHRAHDEILMTHMLQTFNLTRGELLQIANNRPVALVELYLVRCSLHAWFDD